MKILSVGYYDDFARFFLAIKRDVKHTEEVVEFRYFSLYLSGFLYFFIRFQRVVFLPLVVRLLVLFNIKRYKKIMQLGDWKGVSLNRVIRYHLSLGMSSNESLLLQAIGYIEYYNDYLNKYTPDILVLSGDSRMAIQILDDLAKQKGIKTYYFEQGPFGTTILDGKGVNANASIRDKKFFSNTEEVVAKNIISFLRRKRRPAYLRNPIYRVSDYVYQYVFIRVGLLPEDIRMEKRVCWNNNGYSKIKINDNYRKEKYVLLILQVPYDVNMVFHSPLFNKHVDIVKHVYESLPEGYYLLVREHPLYKSRYEKELYSFMYERDIGFDGLELIESMKKASVVVVNNSTVGIEAIAINKPVVILGNCYYDNADIALKLTSHAELPLLLKQALSYEIDRKKVECFLHYFLSDYLVDGHFRDKNIVAVNSIVKSICGVSSNS